MVKIRRAYEGLFLGLFLFFLLITDLRYLKGWPVSLFMEATPLVVACTALRLTRFTGTSSGACSSSPSR